MSWKKEKKEHPWASTATAKRIASDHAKKTRRHDHESPAHERAEKHSCGPLQTAHKDFTLLDKGAKRIAYQRKP
jgi:hypothetical protein